MTDLTNPFWIYTKAALFVVIGVISFHLLLLPHSLSMRLALQMLMIWAFCRAYYFAFYVIQQYVDPTFRFSGLIDFCRYLLHKPK